MYNMVSLFFLFPFLNESNNSYGLQVVHDRKRTCNTHKLLEADININFVLIQRTLKL